jgi:hypothetical protein
MTRRVAFAGLLALALATPVRAGFITGVTASTNMGSDATLVHIVDGSGLSSLSLTATHAQAVPTNYWAGNSFGQVTFDLHGSYTLAGMSVWNFNGDSSFGVRIVTVATSTDGVSFTPLAGGPNVFAQGASFAAEAPEQFTFGPVVTGFVRLTIANSYNSSFTFAGLSEVAFDGSPTSAVPAPPTLLLGLVGAGVTGVARLRQRRR